MTLTTFSFVSAMWLTLATVPKMPVQPADLLLDCEPVRASDGAREKVWASEELDPVWSLDAEAKIRAAVDRTFREVGPESEAVDLASVECRATLCRMDFGRTDEASLMTFLAAFPLHLGWIGGMQLEALRDSTTVLYLVRAGVSAPVPGGAVLRSRS